MVNQALKEGEKFQAIYSINMTIEMGQCPTHFVNFTVAKKKYLTFYFGFINITERNFSIYLF